MTREENEIVAKAQSAFQQAFKSVENEERKLKLMNIGILGLLEAHFCADYVEELDQAVSQ